MAVVTITRGPWSINTALITSTVRTGADSYAVIANGIGYILTRAEALQLGVQNLAPAVVPPDFAKYSLYTAILNQAAVAAPTATVLQNEIGTIVWTRTSAGVYVGTLVAAFPAGKVFGKAELAAGSTGVLARVGWTSADALALLTFDIAGAAADYVGDLFLEIRVYP
jgi:hypothetical protein